MELVLSKNNEAQETYDLVTSLQNRFVNKLNGLSSNFGEDKNFEEVLWYRDKGIHGGGSRYEARDEFLFNTASVNVSQVHYDDIINKNLQSASAISTIIHPKNPKLPSMHMHISLTQLKDKKAYWRIMADLNPAIKNEEDKETFDNKLQELSKKEFKEGTMQGNKYFYIPALDKHRGVSHFYLENYKTGNKQNDYNFVKSFGEGIIDTYIEILENALKTRKEFSVFDIKEQLAYHSLYLFQVLTLDRGTTSGLLIHNQNDKGIMGSLPKFVDKNLLIAWVDKMQSPQNELLKNIISCINTQGLIDIETKTKLANAVRDHYQKYPEALSLQASGNSIPNTVNNHK